MAWPCPGLVWEVHTLAREVVEGGPSGAAAPWGWGKPEPGRAGPPRGPGRGSCPELSVHGGGREAATRSSPCARPWGPAAQPAGSIQSPPQGMLGEAARIRAAGCARPSPSNRGLKWVKEEGGGPGGLGEGPEKLRRHPEGGDQGRMPGKAKPCVCSGPRGGGGGAPGPGSTRAAEDSEVLKVTAESTRGVLRPGSCPQGAGPALSPTPWPWSSFPPSLLQSPTPHPQPAKGSVRSRLRVSPSGQTWTRGGPGLAQLPSHEVWSEGGGSGGADPILGQGSA